LAGRDVGSVVDVKKEPIDECCNIYCQAPIHAGQSVYKAGPDLYCNIKCAVEDLSLSKPEIMIFNSRRGKVE